MCADVHSDDDARMHNCTRTHTVRMPSNCCSLFLRRCLSKIAVISYSLPDWLLLSTSGTYRQTSRERESRQKRWAHKGKSEMNVQCSGVQSHPVQCNN